MKFTRVLVTAMLASVAVTGLAGEVPTGVWQQTSSTAGDCAECQITVTRTTPQIIYVAANNGWKGYAYYSPKEDKYKGAFQGVADHENVVFLMQATYEGNTLSISAQSPALSFTSSYRKK